MAKRQAKPKKLRIRQIRSVIGSNTKQREIMKSLGLRRIRHEVIRDANPAIRGMVSKVRHLIEVSEE